MASGGNIQAAYPQESPQKKPEFTGPGTSDILARLSPRATLGGMQNNLVDLAAQYHKALPGRIHRYLNDRGIPDLVIDFHLLGWHENHGAADSASGCLP